MTFNSLLETLVSIKKNWEYKAIFQAEIIAVLILIYYTIQCSRFKHNRKPDARIARLLGIIWEKEKIRNSSDFRTAYDEAKYWHARMRGPDLTMWHRDERRRYKTSLGEWLARSPHTASDCWGMGIVRERAGALRADVCATGVGNRLSPYLRAPRLTSFLSIQPLKWVPLITVVWSSVLNTEGSAAPTQRRISRSLWRRRGRRH